MKLLKPSEIVKDHSQCKDGRGHGFHFLRSSVRSHAEIIDLSVPVIFFTSAQELGTAMKASALDVDGYLMKLVQPEQLQEKIESVLPLATGTVGVLKRDGTDAGIR